MPSANKTRPKALDGWGMVSTLPPPSVSTHGLTEVAPKRPLRAVASHPHRKVLILEDEPSIRNVLCVLLSGVGDRKSTRLNSSHVRISYAVFCLKKKKQLPNQGRAH